MRLLGILFGAGLLLAPRPARADGLEGRREIGASLGVTQEANIQSAEPRNRSMIFASVRWTAPLRLPSLPTLSPHLRLMVEPNFGTFYHPKGGLILGTNVAVLYFPRLEGRFKPYAGAGAGIFYSWARLLDINFNFTLFPEVGFTYALAGTTSLFAAYRLYHVSNAGLKLPNVGINSNYETLGLAWRY